MLPKCSRILIEYLKTEDKLGEFNRFIFILVKKTIKTTRHIYNWNENQRRSKNK